MTFVNANSTLVQQISEYSHTNSLINENSPYLLQHAHNPVNWFAWTKKAFELAKKTNKPIFLSIGYSTCHWCHVMEQESFENIEIANILNQYFISIKVDREQRPDIDALYMQAAVLLNGQGGWPLNVFITPGGKFFYGASYFPPDKFKHVLLQVQNLWENNPYQLLKMADSIAKMMDSEHSVLSDSPPLKKISNHQLNASKKYFLKHFDSMQGGFSQAPKFPSESILFFLMDSIARKNDAKIYTAISTTLNAMANGGIYDHIGGGFHRYSIDNSWFTPHFEKMLYNQAHLANIYMRFYQLSGNAEYAEVARETIDYVLRDMQASDRFGGFYSASDADSKASVNSKAEEGLFYLWKYNQLKKTLNAEEFEFLQQLYGITEQGNFPEAGKGENILFRYESLTAYANEKNLPLLDVIEQLSLLRKKLYNIRLTRISPYIDKKIVTSWNAMMISTLVEASKVFNHKAYLKAAINATQSLNKANFNGTSLLRNSINGKANVLASQEDYAYFIKALIALYDQTNHQKWLLQAQTLMQQMITLFWDKKQAAFFQDNPLHEVAVSKRLKNIYDSAIPAGNSIAYEVLSQLMTRITDQRKIIQYQQLKDKMAIFYATKKDSLVAMPYLLMVMQKDLLGETSLVQYGANGVLKASLQKLKYTKKGQALLQLTIQLKKAWHINSFSPLQSNLIKTEIKLLNQEQKQSIRLVNLNYPKPQLKKLGFSQTQLSLYEDTVKIHFTLTEKQAQIKPGLIVPIKFSFQACSDKICLAPQSLVFYLPLVH